MTYISVREGTFFLGGEGEGRGILVFFSQKSVGPPLHFNKKTPDPPPLGDWQKCDPPLTTWYVPRGMFYAVETSEHFACERKIFEYK